MSYLGGTRRKHERRTIDERFKCFSAGRRFLGKVTNISAGGCFLELDRVMHPGTVVIVELASQAYGEKAPHLVGLLVHMVMKPVVGAGIRWVKVVAPGGARQLKQFLTDWLQIELAQSEFGQIPPTAREHPVSYDFATGIISLEKKREAKKDDKIVSMFGIKVKDSTMQKLGLADVKVVHSDAPKQKRAVVGEDQSMATRDDEREDPLAAAKELESWLTLKRAGKKIQEQVVMVYEGRNVPAQALSINPTALWVECKDKPPEEQKRLLIQFPVEMAKKTVNVIIVGEVQKRLRNRTHDGWGVSIKIVTFNEGDNVGIFQRYMKNL
jgi:hypothetical protein